MKKTLFTLCLLFAFQMPLHAAIWENQNQWNADWEDRYSDWVEHRFHKHFFTQGRYANTPHDCADSVYFPRLIFAYENRLPFVIRDPRFGQQKVVGAQLGLYQENYGKSPYATVRKFISNDFEYYDEMPEEDRVRFFMKFVGDVVGSNSVIADTYPISLDRKWFRPGVIAALPRLKSTSNGAFFRDEAGEESPGHSQMVIRVDEKGVIHYLKSTVPAKIQELQETTINSFVPSAKGGSFRYWKQPQHYGQPDSSLPGYGEEQFHLVGVFEDEMQKRLASVRETTDQKLNRYAQEVCHQIEQRVGIVDEAWRFKQRIGSRCMDYGEFDSYSTPSRDHKIEKSLRYLVRVATGSENGPVSAVARHLDRACGKIQYLPGKSISAARFSERLLAGSVSSDPNQPPAVRWGDEDPQHSDCKQYY